jgi:hypothetical protein
MDVQNALTGDTESLGGKQWPDSVPGEAPKLPVNNLSSAELLFGYYSGLSANLIQDIHGQPSFTSVLIGDTMDGSHCLSLASSGEEVLGRLVKMEEEETTDEHEEGKCAESDGEVPPAFIVGTVAARNARGRDRTGLE